MRKSLSLLATGIVTALALTACGGSSSPSAEVKTLDPAKPVTLSVGASPVPQAKILEFINQDLAPKAGLKLDIKEIEDYQTPNTALSDGSLDTNYYQHLPWYEDQVKTKGYKFGHGEGVHIEPYAAFSEKVKDIKRDQGRRQGCHHQRPLQPGPRAQGPRDGRPGQGHQGRHLRADPDR